MRKKERESLIEFWQNQQAKEAWELDKNDPVSEVFTLIEFISRRGWGKWLKKPRTVKLLRINGSCRSI